MALPKKRSFSAEFKLEAVNYAEHHSGEAAARKYNVDPRRIREWKKLKQALIEMKEEGKQKKRLHGGGRKKVSEEMELRIVMWILEQRHKNLRVSGKMIRNKAQQMFQTVSDGKRQFNATAGWLQKFMKRNGFSLSQQKTSTQNAPENSVERLIDFIMNVRHLKAEHNYNHDSIIAMDETECWIDILKPNVTHVNAASVPVTPTDNKKILFTVILAAKADGTKLKPYIVFKELQREEQKNLLLKSQETTDVIVRCSENGCMDDHLTSDWLEQVIRKLPFERCLLVWDAYPCHVSESANATLKSNFKTVDVAVIPNDCTGYIQAADVYWKKPFKKKLYEQYQVWMMTSMKKYAAGENVIELEEEDIIQWVKEAWQFVSQELIRESFQFCALTAATDGSEDSDIHCFKPGQPCHSGRAILRQRSHQIDQPSSPNEPGLVVIKVESLFENNEVLVSSNDGKETSQRFVQTIRQKDEICTNKESKAKQFLVCSENEYKVFMNYSSDDDAGPGSKVTKSCL